jgi:hypothetical protein
MITSSLLNESTFNAARFLVNNLPAAGKSHQGISKVAIHYALASLGFKFENYKTSRFGYE